MRRYKFLAKESVYEALNKLRAAFLAAKDGNEVEEIIKGLLTSDERIKIGRRILIAQGIKEGFTYDEIKDELKVGKTTILMVDGKLRSNPLCFELIGKREMKVNEEYGKKSYENIGGSKRILKSKRYTGFKRSNVKR